MIVVDEHIPQGSWFVYQIKSDEREAKLLAGQIVFFYRGTTVKKRSDSLYYVQAWGKPSYEIP